MIPNEEPAFYFLSHLILPIVVAAGTTFFHVQQQTADWSLLWWWAAVAAFASILVISCEYIGLYPLDGFVFYPISVGLSAFAQHHLMTVSLIDTWTLFVVWGVIMLVVLVFRQRMGDWIDDGMWWIQEHLQKD